MAFDAHELSPYRLAGFQVTREILFAAVVMIGVGAVILLDDPSRPLLLMPFAVIGILALFWCSRLAGLSPLWLVFALVLEETLPYTNLLPFDPESRWWLRYPLLLALCVPAIPGAWRSGWLQRGGFKAFIYFFAWAAVTIAWSLAPGISAGRLVPDVLLFIGLVLVMEATRTPQDMEKLFGRFLIGCAILLILTAAAAFVLPVNIFREGDDPAIGVYNWILDDAGILRFSGIFNAPNEIGALAVATAGAGFCYLYCAGALRLRSRLAVIGCIAASLVFAVMADSRSSLMAVAIGLAGYATWRYGARGLAVCVAGLAVVAVIYLTMGGARNAYFGRDVSTLTGRTEAWQFELSKLRQNPVIGYGFEAEGAIFEDRYFPLWEKFWNRGANTPLHNGYLSIAIGVGAPALLVWLFIFLRPWVAALRRPDDPWNLKPIFCFVVLPLLILGLDETGVGEPRYLKGLLLFICWMIAERERLISRDRKMQPEVAPERRLARLVAGPAAAFIIALTTLTFSHTALAADYFVDSYSGSDAATGTSPATPWRTLGKVDHYVFHRGDVVHLRRGSVWREVLAPDGSNHANFKGVSFEPYGSGAAPTINGSDALTSWVRSGGESTYAVRETKLVYNLFVDGEPGWGLMHACCLPSSSCAASPRDPPVRDQTCVIGPMRPGSWFWSGASPAPPASSETLYVWLPDGSDPTRHLIEAVTRQTGIHGWALGDQLDSLTIDGLRIIQTGLRGISLESESRAGLVGRSKGISGLVVRNCIIERTGTGPFDDGSYGNAITIINATAPLVEHNQVSHCGNHGNCINVQNANGARILDNTVDHWNHNGIDVKGSENVLVMGNVASDQRAIGSAYYIEYSENVTYENNRAQDVHNGFQISDKSTARLLNNIIDSAGSGIYLGPRAVSMSLNGNSFNHCYENFGGDGSGVIERDGTESAAPRSGRVFGF